MTRAATYVQSQGPSARDPVRHPRASLPAVRGTGSLFGREVELAAVAAGAGPLVFVEGHAGIGKTSLLETARARARADGVRVLWGCGHELERGFGFGVVRQLFERAVSEAPPGDRARLLAGPAALASVTVGVEPAADRGGRAPDSPLPIVHALYWLTTNLAEREPLWCSSTMRTGRTPCRCGSWTTWRPGWRAFRWRWWWRRGRPSLGSANRSGCWRGCVSGRGGGWCGWGRLASMRLGRWCQSGSGTCRTGGWWPRACGRPGATRFSWASW